MPALIKSVSALETLDQKVSMILSIPLNKHQSASATKDHKKITPIKENIEQWSLISNKHEETKNEQKDIL
jgi:hypothetical protein